MGIFITIIQFLFKIFYRVENA